MIVILEPNADAKSKDYKQLIEHLSQLPNIEHRIHKVEGAQQTLTEIYLIGETSLVDKEAIESLPLVERVIRISEEYRVLGRHSDSSRSSSFEYNG